MTHFKHLLAASDLSAPARHAANRAAMVAKETAATLDLIHVASTTQLAKLKRLVTDIPVGLEQRVIDDAREEMRELAALLLKQHGISSGVHITSGPMLEELSSHADGLGADLVVLGARGASFMRHVLLGSTAERMLSRASRPMLVVKQAAHERYRILLVPVDFSPSSLRAVRNARAIAPDAEIVLLHAFDVPFEGQLRHAGVDEEIIRHYRISARQEAQQKLWSLCDEAGLPRETTRLLVLYGDPLQQIIEQEQEQDCDLIVMGKHGESMLEEWLLGSVTRHVLTESQCDVLLSV